MSPSSEFEIWDDGASAIEEADADETFGTTRENDEVIHFTVGDADHLKRVDIVLAGGVSGFSRSYLQQCVADGDVAIDGVVVTRASSRIEAGAKVAVTLRPSVQSLAFLPEPMEIAVVYEDPHLLVVDKPAGLVVHPAPGNWRGTLLNGLLARDPGAGTLPRAGIVHRLDKDTTGLMVVARSRACMDALVGAMAAREISRRYVAVAHRPWRSTDPGTVTAPVGRDPANRLRMAAFDADRSGTKPAVTHLRAVASSLAFCRVLATLDTGRTHQIRVHMARIGHPLVGDSLYGGAAAGGMSRQALHAFRLGFTHPMTGERKHFEAPIPDDLRQAIRALGLEYNENEHAAIP